MEELVDPEGPVEDVSFFCFCAEEEEDEDEEAKPWGLKESD